MFRILLQDTIKDKLCCFQEKNILMTLCTDVTNMSLIEVCTTNSNMSPRLIVLCIDFSNKSPIALEFFLNGAELSLNSVNSGNLVNH